MKILIVSSVAVAVLCSAVTVGCQQETASQTQANSPPGYSQGSNGLFKLSEASVDVLTKNSESKGRWVVNKVERQPLFVSNFVACSKGSKQKWVMVSSKSDGKDFIGFAELAEVLREASSNVPAGNTPQAVLHERLKGAMSASFDCAKAKSATSENAQLSSNDKGLWLASFFPESSPAQIASFFPESSPAQMASFFPESSPAQMASFFPESSPAQMASFFPESSPAAILSFLSNGDIQIVGKISESDDAGFALDKQ